MKIRRRKLMQKPRITIKLTLAGAVAGYFNQMIEAEWDSFVAHALRQYLKGQQ